MSMISLTLAAFAPGVLVVGIMTSVISATIVSWSAVNNRGFPLRARLVAEASSVSASAGSVRVVPIKAATRIKASLLFIVY